MIAMIDLLRVAVDLFGDMPADGVHMEAGDDPMGRRWLEVRFPVGVAGACLLDEHEAVVWRRLEAMAGVVDVDVFHNREKGVATLAICRPGER